MGPMPNATGVPKTSNSPVGFIPDKFSGIRLDSKPVWADYMDMDLTVRFNGLEIPCRNVRLMSDHRGRYISYSVDTLGTKIVDRDEFDFDSHGLTVEDYLDVAVHDLDRIVETEYEENRFDHLTDWFHAL